MTTQFAHGRFCEMGFSLLVESYHKYIVKIAGDRCPKTVFVCAGRNLEYSPGPSHKLGGQAGVLVNGGFWV